MLLQRSTRLLTRSTHRLFSHSAAALSQPDPLQFQPEPFTYLPDHPRPDPKHDETILAIPRADVGKTIARNERKAGRVPSILFEQNDGHTGGNKRLISVQNSQIKKLLNHLGKTFFLSRLFELEVRPEFEAEEVVEKVRVLPRLVHLQAGTDVIENVTFLRAPSDAWIKVDVPLMFIGEDVSPGLKKGAYLNIIKREIRYLCPADVIPPYIEVDLSALDSGQTIITKNLKVHPALKLLTSENQPVVKVAGARVSEQQKKEKAPEKKK